MVFGDREDGSEDFKFAGNDLIDIGNRNGNTDVRGGWGNDKIIGGL